MFSRLFISLVKLSAISSVVLCLFLAYRWIRRDRTLDSIPGPKGYPFVGNFPVGPPPRTAEVFRGFAREYGELFKFQMGWYNWVAVNSPEAMKELFDKQVRASRNNLASGHSQVLARSQRPLPKLRPYLGSVDVLQDSSTNCRWSSHQG